MISLQQNAPVTKYCQEKLTFLNVEKEQLCACLTIPNERSSHEVGIVYIHGWGGNRNGPHDILTNFARRFAQAGFCGVRFDLRGRGESSGNGFNTALPTMAEDLIAACKLLKKECGVRKIILLGLCSGGNLAIGTLPRLTDISGLVLLSVYPFSDGDSFSRELNRTLYFAKQYLAKALAIHTWKRLFQGDINLKQVNKVLFGHFFKDNKQHEEGSEKKEHKPPQKYLHNLTVDLPAIMLYGSADPDAKAARSYYEEHTKKHHLPISFKIINGANHNFSSCKWSKEVQDETLTFLKNLNI